MTATTDKRFNHTRRWLISLVALSAFIDISQSSESGEEFHYDKRLLPLVRTYLDLQLCANVADTYDNNQSLWDQYTLRAEALKKYSESLGWTSTDFASAMVIAFEEKEHLEVKESDTRESYNRRHYTGDRCEKAMGTEIESIAR